MTWLALCALVALTAPSRARDPDGSDRKTDAARKAAELRRTTGDAAQALDPGGRFDGIIDVRTFGAIGDGRGDDTAGVGKAYDRANALMAAGRSVLVEFPFGHYRVGATPRLVVPDGVDFGVVGARGGSRIDMLAASAAVSVSVRATNGSHGHVAIEDLTFDAAGSGGGNALDVQGVPRSRGGGGVAPTIRDITCDSGDRRPFASCIALSDVSNASIAGLRNLGLPRGNGRPDQGVALWLRTTPDGTANSNFSVDDHVEDFEQVGGFAFLRTDGHVEGVQMHHGTVAASSYGTYSTVFPGGKGGVLWLSVTDTHLDTVFAGVYCEHCTSVKVANDLFYAFGAVVPDAGAALPANWAAFLGSAPTGWAGVWCPDCKGMTIADNEFYGFIRHGQASTALYGFGHDFGGGYPGDLWGNTVTGNVIGAMSSGPLVLDGHYGKTAITGNVFNTTTKTLRQAIDPAAGVLETGNLQDAGSFPASGHPSASEPPPVATMTLDGSSRSNGRGSTTSGGPASIGQALHLDSVTVARLPPTCAPGDMRYVADARKPSETPGTGSGAPAICTRDGRNGGVTWFSMFSGTRIAG